MVYYVYKVKKDLTTKKEDINMKILTTDDRKTIDEKVKTIENEMKRKVELRAVKYLFDSGNKELGVQMYNNQNDAKLSESEVWEIVKYGKTI